MDGYKPTTEDIAITVSWLKRYHPENANQDYAVAMLLDIRNSYRQIGWTDPDKLEDFYREYSQKLLDQNGKTSDA